MVGDKVVKNAFNSWYKDLPGMKRYAGRPAKGTVAAALVVLERLRGGCDLSLDAHLAAGRAQIAGLNASALRKILNRFGEHRGFPSEGGRTNRGNNIAIEHLLGALGEAGFAKCKKRDRSRLIDWMQERLVTSLDAYYRLEGIRFGFDVSRSVRSIVGEILSAAQKRQQGGPVAQHLVGAKLAIRFPDKEVGNFPYSAADDQAGRAGDFHVGETAFHVTVAPGLGHVDRCEKNVRGGLKVFVVVPDPKVTAARTLLGTKGLEEKVAVESIESFVGQNLSEIGEFSPEKEAQALADLLHVYNQRVSEVETDGSLLIEIPTALRRQEG